MAWVTGLHKKYLPFVNLSRLLCKTDKLFKMKFHSQFFCHKCRDLFFFLGNIKKSGCKNSTSEIDKSLDLFKKDNKMNIMSNKVGQYMNRAEDILNYPYEHMKIFPMR